MGRTQNDESIFRKRYGPGECHSTGAIAFNGKSTHPKYLFCAVADAVHSLNLLYLRLRFLSFCYTFYFCHLRDHQVHPLIACSVDLPKMGEQFPGDKQLMVDDWTLLFQIPLPHPSILIDGRFVLLRQGDAWMEVSILLGIRPATALEDRIQVIGKPPFTA